MENIVIIEWLKWLGIIIAAVLGSKLIETIIKRRWTQGDARVQINTINEGKRIDADVDSFAHIIKRLETVENRVDVLQEKLATEMVNNARLTTENEALKKENERQAKRLHDFAAKLQNKDAEILDLRNLLHATQIDLEKLRSEVRDRSAGP